MKITKIECLELRAPQASPADCDGAVDTAVVRVTADNGACGLGETDAPPNAIAALLESLGLDHPKLTPKEREHRFLRECGAAFIIGIGGRLADGTIHDGRALDYDDWSTPGPSGQPGLNGDIFVWNPVLKMAFELSSMGIRVDKESMLRQLEIRGCPERQKLFWHRKLLKGQMPLSIGGGIGQSRLCMYFLRKAHVGEIQASLWPEEMVAVCRKHNIPLL